MENNINSKFLLENLNEEIHFKVKTWVKIVTGLSLVFFLLFSFIMFIGSFIKLDQGGMLIGLVSLIFWGTISLFFGKYEVYVSKTRIRVDTFYKQKFLSFDEIVGYYYRDNFGLILVGPDNKKIILSPYLLESQPFQSFIMANYENLDLKNAKEALKEECFSNLTPEELSKVKSRLNSVFVVVTPLVVILTLLSFFNLAFPPEMRNLLFGSIFILVLFVTSYVIKYNGAFKYDTENRFDKRIDASILYVCLFVSHFFFIQRIFLVNKVPLQIASIVFGLFAFYFFYKQANKLSTGKKMFITSLISVLSALFIFSVIVYFNTTIDTAPSKTFETTILGKCASGGRNRSWQLTVAPWGPVISKELIDINKSIYEQAKIGDKVEIRLHRGMFGIEWYELDSIKAQLKSVASIGC